MSKKDEKMRNAAEDVKESVEKSVKGVRKLLQEFKEFALRGNMVDIAVGIVLGTAFTAMVNAVLKGILEPLVKHFTGQSDTDKLVFYGFDIGMVLDAIIHFIIVAAVIFIVVKAMNALASIKNKQKEDEDKKAMVTEVEVLEEIRDLLKESKGAGADIDSSTKS